MTFLAPWVFMAGVAAAMAVVALHLLTTRRPPAMRLPTARFVPVAEARAVARASRPTDLLLLALRALAVLLIGAAFARPVREAAGPSVRTVVMVERSRAVGSDSVAMARAWEMVGEGGAVVEFGAVARELPLDSLDARDAGLATVGSLSAGLIAARRAAERIAPGADSLRLVLVSPLVAGSVDAATPALRASWPGRMEIVRMAVAEDTARGTPARLVTPLDDDPLAPALDRLGALRGAHDVRVVRGAVSAADSAWTQERGRVLLVWPARFDEPVAAIGVIAFPQGAGAAATVVAPFARLALPQGVAAAANAASTRILARWNDGVPAVQQTPLGAGCIRHVGIGIPLAGDITLRAPFARLLDVLTEPCDGRIGAALVLTDSSAEWLEGGSASPLASARVIAAAAQGAGSASRLPAVLLAIALSLLLAEYAARRARLASGARPDGTPATGKVTA